MALAAIILTPVALVVAFVSLGAIGFLLSASKLIILARQATRPLAIQPPIGCETVREAVVHATPFRQGDYSAGLWPREEIAAKVRLIVAKVSGVPFEAITEDTPISELMAC